MEKETIKKYTELLFSAALKKCSNFSDAEDLTQETLCCYFQYKKPVDEPVAWLKTVMYRKYYDLLRRKYRLPTVRFDIVPEFSESFCDYNNDYDSEQNRPGEEEIRREVAYLSEKYREVIVSHYLYGEKVNDIAARLNIPKGTVLSRLSAGREQMRKGFEDMNAYEKHSYRPECLEITCYGAQGFHDEPLSLVKDNLLKQNILISAYNKPLADTEIAKSLGVPTAYVEAAVNDLVRSELMCRTGAKVFTDFMIITPDDLSKTLEPQIEFTKTYYSEMLKIIAKFFNYFDNVSFIQELSKTKQNKLKHFFLLHLLSVSIFNAAKKLIPDEEIFPQRPDGGRWIAQGIKYPKGFNLKNSGFSGYSYGGERRSVYENTLGAKIIDLHIYDTQPDLNKYNKGPLGICDKDLPLILYAISRGIPFEYTNIDISLLKSIPYLCECGILTQTDSNPKVDIPIIMPEEYSEIESICSSVMCEMIEFLYLNFKTLFPKIKFNIPKHLEERIAKFRKYYCYAIPMAFIKESARLGDLGIQNDVPPMVLVVDDQNKGLR